LKPVSIHIEAEADFNDALAYLENQRFGLGGEFRRDFETALQRVRLNPQNYAEEDEGVRFCPLRKFPYTLVYMELDDRIWVVAISHQRRRPRYWAQRLQK
jgi:toxin ParE1/3/4